MVRITAPAEAFDGKVVGVTFVKSVAETEDAAAIAYFTRQGYTLGDGSEPAGDAAGADSDGKRVTPKQAAVAAATAAGIDATGTQAEIEARLEEHAAAKLAEVKPEGTPAAPADGAPAPEPVQPENGSVRLA